MSKIRAIFFVVFFLCLILPAKSFADQGVQVSKRGNQTLESFSKTKKALEQKVYFDHRTTIYCQASFDQNKQITLPSGFSTPSHEKRAQRLEWEHAVPCENFGRIFREWREGDPQCVDNKGKPFKGRNCAEKVNHTYRRMQCDMYNLFPSIGAVNAIRSNLRYAALPSDQPTFGSCPMKVSGNAAEPPDWAKGEVARAALYMDWAYGPAYQLSRQQKQLFSAWDKQYPVSEWECQRAKRIQVIQGNTNPFITNSCK